MADKTKIVIGVPCTGTVYARTMFSLLYALKKVKFDYELMLSMGCDLIETRTNLVNLAIENKATHILFLDHDMFFPSNGTGDSPIQKLLDADKDIIGVPYNKRKFPIEAIDIPVTERSEKDLYKCQSIGTGLMLIKTDVFKKIPMPWFHFGRGEKGEMVYGEDTFFCQQAIKNGFNEWAEPTIFIKHLGEYHY